MSVYNKVNKNSLRLLESIGIFFRAKRKSCKMTQGQVASHLGVHTQFISNMERGISPFPNAYKKKLLKLYDIDPHEFLDFLMDQQEVYLRSELGIKA